MPVENAQACIPFRAYWCTPFCRWQGSLAGENAVELAARTAAIALEQRDISPDSLDGVVLGMTVPQKHAFYGAPWMAAMIGATGVTGPTVSQACATSVRVLQTAAGELASGVGDRILAVACDRTSNGPLLIYPRPSAPGGRGETEDWVWDNFNRDPYAGKPMLATAENVAAAEGITREEQEEATLLRYEQYQSALANDRAFQKAYMVPVELRRGKKTLTVEADEGVHPTTREGLKQLEPVIPDGTVTFGAQTHPADGNAGCLVTSEAHARDITPDGPVTRLLAFASARVEKAHMPRAVVPAARAALEKTGLTFTDLAAVTTHNPFAVNDVYFSRESGIPLEAVNTRGSSLVFGHPQGPTGLRAVMELIEVLAERGGGVGLFSGCAAGDTAMACVLRVG